MWLSVVFYSLFIIPCMVTRLEVFVYQWPTSVQVCVCTMMIRGKV